MSTDIPPSDDYISEEETEYFEWLYQQGYNLVVGLLFGGLAHVLVRLYSSNGKQKESNPIDEKLDQMILGKPGDLLLFKKFGCFPFCGQLFK